MEIEKLDPDNKIAAFAKAISNPTRVKILRIMMDQKYCECGDNCVGKNCKCGCNCGLLVDRLPFAQSTISQHIKELKSAGLINISGRKGKYTLNINSINEGMGSIARLFEKTFSLDMEDKKNCNCGDNCQCGETCTCGDECKSDDKCHCGDDCNCSDNCSCGERCNCNAECNCGDDCRCTDIDKCSPECTCNK